MSLQALGHQTPREPTFEARANQAGHPQPTWSLQQLPKDDPALKASSRPKNVERCQPVVAFVPKSTLYATKGDCRNRRLSPANVSAPHANVCGRMLPGDRKSCSRCTSDSTTFGLLLGDSPLFLSREFSAPCSPMETRMIIFCIASRLHAPLS
jgi:hypothetical protein